MFDLPGPLGTFVNFLTIALGFGSIIFIHELGHFVAAKWAGIRVQAFSIGFGNVLCSYRKGIGFRKGSSDSEYRKLTNTDDVSPTEYRLSMLPLGGYVKMLGQEDLNPDAVSDAPDSYQNCPVGKRMVVICAGVVMNLIMAATLFIIVFMVGLKSFPAEVGFVGIDSPASKAIAINNPEITGGLLRGDHILSVNGKAVHTFEDILPEIAMSSKSKPALVVIERDGFDQPIEFEASPTPGLQTGLLDLGISPAVSTTLRDAGQGADRRVWDMAKQGFGMGELISGDKFVSVDGQSIKSPFDIFDIAEASNAEPITIQVQREGETFDHTVAQVPALQTGFVKIGDQVQGTRHILGLAGVLMVNPHASQEDIQQGLKPGDIFARIANIEYPSMSQGIVAIRAHKGQSLDLVVLRNDEDGIEQRIKLTVEVKPNGTVGFYQDVSTSHTNLLSMPALFRQPKQGGDEGETEFVALPASTLIESPGSRIAAVGDHLVANLRDVHLGLLNATADAYQAGDETFVIPITIQLPLPIQPDGSIPTTVTDWTLTRGDIDQVRELGWTLPGSLAMVDMFDFAQVVDKADGPMDALDRGLGKSRRVMMQTYITFLRLFQGTVKVEHLKGPVGIAHVGTQMASQGWVWILFFMAVISVNLAVINFLPLPIVDGGQFLMLVYEWIRGKPVSIVFQNITTLAGLALIGTIFLYVTFNDVKALFGI